MITCVRFCLSYNPFKLEFIAFKFDSCSTKNAWLTWTSSWRYLFPPKCYITCGYTIFITWSYPLNMINYILHYRIILLLDSEGQGPIVQSVVSLTSSLRVISLTVLVDSIHNILIFFAEKMWVAFALQKLLTFFQQNISAYLRITGCKF